MHRRSAGFTLIELLVSISVISILVALLLPAVQSAREAARKVQCRNNLKQIVLAGHLHSDVHKTLPYGGWGSLWVGDPEKGFGDAQPGGWIYNSLPFLEQSNVRALENGAFVDISLPVFTCPTRRTVEPWPYTDPCGLLNAPRPDFGAKSDYAANGGDLEMHSCVTNFDVTAARLMTGIALPRTVVRTKEILDGMSNTYYAGEKYVSRRHYGSGMCLGDDQSMYVGDDEEIRRFTFEVPRRDDIQMHEYVFGSAHSRGCFFAYCDGSVRWISYNIEPSIHRLNGHKDDHKMTKDVSL